MVDLIRYIVQVFICYIVSTVILRINFSVGQDWVSWRCTAWILDISYLNSQVSMLDRGQIMSDYYSASTHATIYAC